MPLLTLPHPELTVTVGLTGPHASGKNEIVKILKKFCFEHFSARDDVLTPEVRRRGLPENDRTSLGIVANDLRRLHGPEEVAWRLYQMARASGKDSAIESIYTTGEINRIRTAADGRFILIAVDADPKIRYTRMIEIRRGATDNISFEKFLEQQEREMQSADPTKHNLRACWNEADLQFFNNGTPEELEEFVLKDLELILKSRSKFS